MLRTSGERFTLKTVLWGGPHWLGPFPSHCQEAGLSEQAPLRLADGLCYLWRPFFLTSCHYKILKGGMCWEVLAHINQCLCARALQCLVSVTVCSNGQTILKIPREADMVGLQSSCRANLPRGHPWASMTSKGLLKLERQDGRGSSRTLLSSPEQRVLTVSHEPAHLGLDSDTNR